MKAAFLMLIYGISTNASVHDEAVTSALREYKRLDAVVLNAATLDPLGRVSDPGTSVDGWKSLFDVNVFSLLHTLKAAIPSLRKSHGRVVMVSSGASTGGVAGWGAYSASKAALNSLVRFV